jgi:hypothetical protein
MTDPRPDPEAAQTADEAFAARVAELEAEGLTTSDAQSAAEAEALDHRNDEYHPKVDAWLPK